MTINQQLKLIINQQLKLIIKQDKQDFVFSKTQALLAVGAVVGVIAYRVSVLAALQIVTKDASQDGNSTLSTTKELIFKNASIVTSVTAACINLLFIIILNMVTIGKN